MDSVNKYGSDGVPFTGEIAEIKSEEQQLQEIAQQFNKTLQEMVDELIPICQRIADTIVSAFNQCFDRIVPIWEEVLKTYPDKRVVHLALYHKKERVRKKNSKRIIEYFTKAVKHHDNRW